MIFREIFDGRIDGLRVSSKAVKTIIHPGTKGTIREAFVQNLLSGLLHPDFDQKEGICIDRLGGQSKQMDVIIFDRSVVPPLYVQESSFIPIDSVSDLIEVKSNLNKIDIEDCYRKAECVYSMKTAGYFPRFHVFAYSSGIDRSVRIADRVRTIGEEMGINPNYFHSVVVLDRELVQKIGDQESGTFGVMREGDWENRNDVVAAFVSGIINHIYDLKGPVKISPGYFIFGNHDNL